jgi:hypothetical protein
MGAWEYRQHAQSLVVLYEPHSAHVCGELVHLCGTVGNPTAVAEVGQVTDDVLDVGDDLMPLRQRLRVHSAYALALRPKIRDEMTADETSASGDQNEFVGHEQTPWSREMPSDS